MQPAIGVKDYAAREVNQAQLDAAQAACQPHSNQPMYSIAPSCRPALYLALGSNVSCSGGDACYHIITPLTINVSNICRQQREQAGRSSCVGGRQAGPHVCEAGRQVLMCGGQAGSTLRVGGRQVLMCGGQAGRSSCVGRPCHTA